MDRQEKAQKKQKRKSKLLNQNCSAHKGEAPSTGAELAFRGLVQRSDTTPCAVGRVQLAEGVNLYFFFCLTCFCGGKKAAGTVFAPRFRAILMPKASL